MAVELDGNVRMRGDTGPGVGVRVVAQERRIRLVSGNELVGDWNISEIGITALQEGFSVKAEGEEFILRTEDDVALAEEMGVVTASPRLARRLAARHNPEERPPPAEPPSIPSNLAAIGIALSGALLVLGGTLLNAAEGAPPPADTAGDGFEFWLAFIVGGVLMIGVAYVMSLGARLARIIAFALLAGVVVVFGFAVSDASADASELTAYGFVAGGIVVGVAVLFSGSAGRSD
jgi:hypothetical protein